MKSAACEPIIQFFFSSFVFLQGAVSHLCQMVNKQLYQLIEYARRMPHFAQLQREDQITLLRAGWNELLIATVAWRSIEVCVDVIRLKCVCNV